MSNATHRSRRDVGHNFDLHEVEGPGITRRGLPGRILRTRGDRPSVRPEWTSVLDVGDSAGFYVSGHLTGVMLAGSGW